MIWIGAAILLTTALLVVFAFVNRLQGNTREVIMVNYGVASAAAVVAFGWPNWSALATYALPTCLLAVLFYVVFNVVARCAETSGVAVAGVATKMSVVVPVAIGLFWLGEPFHWTIVLGIALGIASVLITSRHGNLPSSWLLPLAAFAGSAAVDSSFKLFQTWFVGDFEADDFSALVFAAACVVAVVHHIMLGGRAPQSKSWLWGALLGLCNVASLVSTLHALSLDGWPSSVVYPLINIGVVALSSLVGWSLFGETFTRRSLLAMGLAVATMICLSWHQW